MSKTSFWGVVVASAAVDLNTLCRSFSSWINDPIPGSSTESVGFGVSADNGAGADLFARRGWFLKMGISSLSPWSAMLLRFGMFPSANYQGQCLRNRSLVKET